jgi:Uma2 family endonuclease
LKGATVIPIIPEIAAEVLSPEENTRTLLRKLRQYFDAGVKEVWVIDPESCTAQIWPGPHLPDHELSGGDELTSPLLPGFVFPLRKLFA